MVVLYWIRPALRTFLNRIATKRVIAMKPKNTEGPFNFDGREVYFDLEKSEFWDSKTDSYLDHEIGLVLIDLYFGHQKAPLGPKK